MTDTATPAPKAPKPIVLTLTRDELSFVIAGHLSQSGAPKLVEAVRAFSGAIAQPEFEPSPDGKGFRKSGLVHEGDSGAAHLLATFGDKPYRNLVLDADIVARGVKRDIFLMKAKPGLDEAIKLSEARRAEMKLEADASKESGKPVKIYATKAEVDGVVAGKPVDSPVGKALAAFGDAVRQPVWKDGKATKDVKEGKEGLAMLSEGFGKANHRRVELSLAAIQDIQAKLAAKDPQAAVTAMVELGEAGTESERRGDAIAKARQAAAAGKGR